MRTDAPVEPGRNVHPVDLVICGQERVHVEQDRVIALLAAHGGVRRLSVGMVVGVCRASPSLLPNRSRT